MRGNTHEATSLAVSNGVVRLRLSGELDLESCDAIEPETAIASEARHVEIDLDEVTFIDSTGLGVLLLLRRRADSLGIPFALLNIPPQARRLITISGLEQYLGLPRHV